MKKISTILLVVSIALVLNSANVYSQGYCSPTFAIGCFTWKNQAISFSTVNWVDPGTCASYDFTSDTGTADAGVPIPMYVTCGSWCGCSVWIDLNNDSDFADTLENLYSSYMANDTNHYSFLMTIPTTTPSGNYRMRVIASWGSDGTTVSSNGYGSCGSYQYGNFDDFTLRVSNTTGIYTHDKDKFSFVTGPNPVTNTMDIRILGRTGSVQQLAVTDLQGRVILNSIVTSDLTKLDLSVLSEGIYFVNYTDGLHSETHKFIKD